MALGLSLKETLNILICCNLVVKQLYDQLFYLIVKERERESRREADTKKGKKGVAGKGREGWDKGKEGQKVRDRKHS